MYDLKVCVCMYSAVLHRESYGRVEVCHRYEQNDMGQPQMPLVSQEREDV